MLGREACICARSKAPAPNGLFSQPEKVRDLFADRQDAFHDVRRTVRNDRRELFLIAPGQLRIRIAVDARLRRAVEDFFVRDIQKLAESVEHVQGDTPAAGLDAAPMLWGLIANLFAKDSLRHVCVQTDAAQVLAEALIVKCYGWPPVSPKFFPIFYNLTLQI